MDHRREERLFWKNVKKIRNFLEACTLEEALAHLIEMGAFENEDECRKRLKQTPFLAKIVDELMKQTLHFPYLEASDKFFKRQILEELIEKAATYLNFSFQHFELLDNKYAFVSGIYLDNKEIQWYLDYIRGRELLEKLMHTCALFQIDELDQLHYYSIERLVFNIIHYINHCHIENEEDKQLYQKMKQVWKDVPPLVFLSKELETIDYDLLEMMFQNVRYDFSAAYDRKNKKFIECGDYISPQQEIEDFYEEVECNEDMVMISTSDIDQKVLLEMYVNQLEADENTLEQLNQALYGRKPFKKCKQIFQRMQKLNEFYLFMDIQIQRMMIGWCIRNGFKVREKELR